jgi:hypothetical protein
MATYIVLLSQHRMEIPWQEFWQFPLFRDKIFLKTFISYVHPGYALDTNNDIQAELYDF